MSFCIQNGESADQALHRLLNERTLRARKKLTEPLGDSAIHEVRRELKRVRAVLDLAQAHVRSKDHRRWQHRLHQCSLELAGARDARARVQSLSLISAVDRAGIANGFWKGLDRRLHKEASTLTRSLNRQHRPRRVRRWLKELAEEFQSRRWAVPGWQELGERIRETYRRGRRCWRQVQARPSARNQHRWRRCTKKLTYQLALLQPKDSDSLAGWVLGLERLGDQLGEDHDLFLLRELVRSERWKRPFRTDRDKLLRVIKKRRRKISADALNLGKPLFALRSSQFRSAVLSQRCLDGLKSSDAARDLASDWSSDRSTQEVPVFEDRAGEAGNGVSPAPNRADKNRALPEERKTAVKRGSEGFSPQRKPTRIRVRCRQSHAARRRRR
jgi:CHAD domain-containing protein